MRHCLATHLFEDHYDICTIQELPGHKDVKTTVVYSHILNRGGLVVRSTKNRGVDVGKIDIMRKFSFFEVDERFTHSVIRGFAGMTFKKQKVVVEISTPSERDEASRRPAKRKGPIPKRKAKKKW